MANLSQIRRRSVAIGLLASALVSGPLAAIDGTHRAAAKEYLEVTQLGYRMASVLGDLKARQLEALKKWYIPKVRQAQTTELVEAISEALQAELSWEHLESDFVELYAQVFTEAELRGLIAFYRTPLGQNYARKRQALIRQSLAFTERRLKGILPRIESILSELTSDSDRGRDED